MTKSPLLGKPQRSPFSDYSSIVPPRGERTPVARSADDIYVRGMERLVTVSQELSHARSLEAVQQVVRTAARQLTGADGATIVLRDGDQCHYADEDAMAPLWKGLRFPMSSCISGWVISNRCSAVLEDIYADARISADTYRPTFVKSLVMVPIRASDPIGAIGCYWAKRHMPTHVELRLLSALADSMSIAHENVQLCVELEARVRECSEALVVAQRAEQETRHEMMERQRAEQALRRSQEQLSHAQKMEAVGQLAAGIAHDFNNVLSIVLSYTALIAGQLEPGNPLRADADEVTRAGERAAALTRQLLTFSRQQVVEPKLMGLNDVIAGTENMLRRLVGSNIELLINPFAKADRMMADPGQVEQVLINLTVNARDAIGPSGKLTIETANVCVIEQDPVHEGVAPGEYVALSVTDTGHGMSAEVRSRIFEPFFTTKERGKGTGLGLSNVHGIVLQSAGRIAVTSEPGAGSTFNILWPRHADDRVLARR